MKTEEIMRRQAVETAENSAETRKKYYVRRLGTFQDGFDDAVAAWQRCPEVRTLEGYRYDRAIFLGHEEEEMTLWAFHRPHDRSNIYLDSNGEEWIRNRYFHYFVRL